MPEYKATPYFPSEKKSFLFAKLNMSFSSVGSKQKEIKLYHYEIITSKFNILNIIVGERGSVVS
jgi:hypothetical protein